MTDRLRIVFVDDEPHVLRGLKRSMHEMDDVWDMEFFASGQEALRWLDHHDADVLVSDMRMPQMDGAQFLDAARRRHPQTIRVILSGYAEAGAVLKTVDLAHIYLAKPCDPLTLAAAIARPLELRRFLAEPALRAAVGGLSSLPSLPARLRQLMAEVSRPDASAASVADIIAGDLAMTAEILKLTNSSFFGLTQRVTSVLQAVKTLGLETIQALALQAGLFRQLGDPAGMLDDLTAYGLALGRLARDLVVDEGCSAGQASATFCAGMLSPIGALILLDHDPVAYAQVLRRGGDGGTLAMAETERFGASHEMIGAYLLGLWGFPDAVVEAVAFSGRPGDAPNPDSPVLTALHMARALGPRFPLLAADAVPVTAVDTAYLIDIRRDGRLSRWRQLAQTLARH